MRIKPEINSKIPVTTQDISTQITNGNIVVTIATAKITVVIMEKTKKPKENNQMRNRRSTKSQSSNPMSSLSSKSPLYI